MSKIIKISVMLFSLAMLCGCNYKAKKQEELLKNQQLLKEQKKEDSLAKVNSLYAWGDAKFGMTSKETLLTQAFKGGDKYSDYIEAPFEASIIDGLIRKPHYIRAYFKVDELYLVEIMSWSFEMDESKDITDDILVITNKFKEKYGDPLDVKDVTDDDFRPGRSFLFEYWIVGDKTIQLWSGEDYDHQIYYKVDITNKNFPTKVDQKEIKEQAAYKKKVEERAKYQF